ncbi:hypothetical protein HPB50_019307 [Hyalomma asiaticum]|uniref:Uncharacterized protein n=1 Tax=Hyalomma asiaticum TaxID=266040 RepID=A0ACB7S6E5_HYAAI|nr:hypothetical protein HPB50_019307 [Hyalomma asiaticum]
MSGYIGDLSERQQAALEKDLQWRKDNGVDDLLQTYKIPDSVKENFPGVVIHPCKDERPMWIIPSCVDIKSPYFFPIFWQIVRPFLSQRTVDKVEVYGREGWKERLLSIVDADSLPAIWGGNMTGPDGDPQCRDKIARKAPEEKHEKCLLDGVDALMKAGGTATTRSGKDPLGKVNYGGRFEEGFDREAHSLFGEADVHQRIIGRRDRWELPINVFKAGARISWRFQTAAGDLAFGLRMSGGKHLVPLQRIEASSYIPQRGSWQCDSPGTYVLEFDNTHSWLNGKTLAYMVDLSAPEDDS